MEYINFHTEFASSRWQRGAFFRRWWRLASDDRRWTPPLYHSLLRLFLAQDNPHLERLAGVFLHQEAARTARGSGVWEPQAWLDGASTGSASLGILTAAAGVLPDPRLEPGRAYLFLPQVINHPDCIDALFDALFEACSELGIHHLIGPVAFSPHLESGLQMDSWHQFPPVLAAGNPPYLPELLTRHMQPLDPGMQLWQLDLSSTLPGQHGSQAIELEPLDRSRWSGELLPLLAAACESLPGIPQPDQREAEFLLSRLPPGVHGWLARSAGQPAGYLLAGAEISPALCRWNGGRGLPASLLLRLALRQPFPHGRIYFAGVLPEFRRQGIGLSLILRSARHARQQGWRTLICGPLPDGSPGSAFLASLGAQPRGEYRLFELEW